jgi:hypothetical protein
MLRFKGTKRELFRGVLTTALSACPVPQVGVGERERRNPAFCSLTALPPRGERRLFPLLGERVRVRGKEPSNPRFVSDQQ